jgi:hypothetical protein
MSSMTGRSAMRSATGDQIPKGYQKGSLQQFTPEQQQLFSQLFGHLGPESFLGKLAGGDQSQFEQLEQPALRQFGALQGNIASRFSGMGSGARKSSGFGLAQNQAAQDFAGQLQSQRMGLQRQALQDLMGYSNQLLGQRPQENFLAKKEIPFWQQLLLGIGEAGGQAAAAWAGGSLQKPSANKTGMATGGTF